MKNAGIPISAVTAYDYQMSSYISQTDIDFMLVGDSLGMVVMGHKTTIPVRLSEIVHHTKAVSKAEPSAAIVSDMPFLTYGIDTKQTIKNAAKLIRAGANAVKVEGGQKIINHIRVMIDNGIPVMGHLGMQPQSVLKERGFKLAGRRESEAKKILEDALMLEELGVCAIVLECIPESLGSQVSNSLKIPTIGIGAGRMTDGQILVVNDLLGMTEFEKSKPKFVKHFAQVGNDIRIALESYSNAVKSKNYPSKQQVYLPDKHFTQNKTITTVSKATELYQTDVYTRKNIKIGFVPTMGALHQGHLSLIERAKAECDVVVASIFVNPKQFGPNEDFASYPREVNSDIDKLERAGCDIVFIPEKNYIYPNDDYTELRIEGPLTESLCGKSRPGHFNGVATIVAKLFNIVKPQRAYFGLKDYQQYLIIKKLVSDLFMDIKIIGCPTFREPDGLAMSSRNLNLSNTGRKNATVINQTLQLGAAKIKDGETETIRIEQLMEESLRSVSDLSIDYACAVDSETLIRHSKLKSSVLLAIAAKIDGIRLIDNLIVEH